MDALFTGDSLVALGIIAGLALTVVGFFAGNIIIFECIALALVSGSLAGGIWDMHPALCIIIGLAVLATTIAIQSAKPGFWIIGGALSLVFGFVLSLIAYRVSARDMGWTYAVLALGTLIMLLLHIRAKHGRR